ncbi:hypothetical protein D3C78_19450 [compost metagenome]
MDNIRFGKFAVTVKDNTTNMIAFVKYEGTRFVHYNEQEIPQDKLLAWKKPLIEKINSQSPNYTTLCGDQDSGLLMGDFAWPKAQALYSLDIGWGNTVPVGCEIDERRGVAVANIINNTWTLTTIEFKGEAWSVTMDITTGQDLYIKTRLLPEYIHSAAALHQLVPNPLNTSNHQYLETLNLQPEYFGNLCWIYKGIVIARNKVGGWTRLTSTDRNDFPCREAWEEYKMAKNMLGI